MSDNQHKAQKSNPAICGNVWVVGDIHGSLQQLGDAMKLATHYENQSNASVSIIVLGDVGLGFPADRTGSRTLVKMGRLAKTFNVDVYLIRGNHDNPEVWNGTEASEAMAEHGCTNVTLLHDGIVLVNNEKYLVVSGGLSIDKEYREEGQDWWPDESVSISMDVVGDAEGVTGILSHTGPRPSIVSIGLPAVFASADKDAQREQAVMAAVGNAVLPEKWVYGHFHRTWAGKVPFCRLVNEGRPAVVDCECRAVNIGEAVLLSPHPGYNKP